MLVTCVHIFCTTLVTNNNIKIVIQSSTFLIHLYNKLSQNVTIIFWYFCIYMKHRVTNLGDYFTRLYHCKPYFNIFTQRQEIHILGFFFILSISSYSDLNLFLVAKILPHITADSEYPNSNKEFPIKNILRKLHQLIPQFHFNIVLQA